MLQDILPHIYHSEYRKQEPKDSDIIILQKGRQLLLGMDDALSLPTFSQVRSLYPGIAGKTFYLFSIDDQAYFAAPADTLEEKKPFSWRCGRLASGFLVQPAPVLWTLRHPHSSFRAGTGYHLSGLRTCLVSENFSCRHHRDRGREQNPFNPIQPERLQKACPGCRIC